MPALHFFEHGRLSLRCRANERCVTAFAGGLLTPRTQSPDAGRGADAEREGIPDLRMWESVKV